MSNDHVRTTTLTRLFSLTRTGVLLILVGHLLACIAVLILLPGRWPMWSVETIGYRALPIAIASVLIAAATLPRHLHAERFALAMLLGLWIGAAVASVVLFPISGVRIAGSALIVAFVIALALIGMTKAITYRGLIALGVVACIAAVVAIVPIRLLQAPPISTRPGESIFEDVAAGSVERRTLRLDANFSLDPTQAVVNVNAGKRVIFVQPVLTFVQRSPDACWTIFAPRARRVPPTRELRSTIALDAMIEAAYLDLSEGDVVAVDRLNLQHVDDRTASINAYTALQQPVWSHLNTFTELTVAGHRDLNLRFSPAFDVPITVTNAGYPLGAPARFAYVDREKTFHIVEATSAEKGPFKELATGRLDGPLTITLCDGDEAFFEVRLDDWTSQVSVEPSPTAGWGVPQNAIEFGLQSDSPKSPATIFVSLASTSVGRGWNSVGHAAGVYRNRIRMRVLSP